MSSNSEMPQEQGAYEAVIYVHGIGSQRRFEESGRLIDSIDRYLYALDPDIAKRDRYLTSIRAKIEPSDFRKGGFAEYIRTKFRDTRGDGQGKYVRFYEIYWAPVLAGRQSAKRVLIWLLSQSRRPMQTAFSPWRERQRLRRSSLMALMERHHANKDGFGDIVTNDFRSLADSYHYFEGPQALRDYPTGKFKQFKAFLAERSENRPDRLKRHLKLADMWKREYALSECRNALFLATTLLAIVLSVALAGWFLFILLGTASGFLAGTSLSTLADLAPDTWGASIGLLFAILSALGVGKVATDYLGDIEAWSAYRETDEKNERRQAILEESLATLKHVLADDNCQRVTIVGHSLGTTIAHDMLLIAARENRATNPADPIAGPTRLSKIKHFVTLGSPIDKIEYFFESHVGSSHRYKRVIEGRRGDIGSPPFSRNGKPYVHWINFWDDADPVSGPLHSPANHKSIRQRVDNVHVQSLTFPIPGKSHSAYFENRQVIESIYQVIFEGSHSFHTVTPGPQKDAKWEDAYIAKTSNPIGKRWYWYVMAISLPWITAVTLAVYFLMVPERWVFAPAGFMTLVLVLGYLFNRRKVPRDPV